MKQLNSFDRVYDGDINDSLSDHHFDTWQQIDIIQTDQTSKLNITQENEVLQRNVEACERRYLALKAITREEL